ncbi:transcriptional regulator [Halobacteroides halobius DSM 5150]|uniref:Transcriptional regulator n=1 Tax=Halobacteroides halobius (strain ATCC 35273 / DSM 5150 / MD-1) TaxID=748449 RepID=L0K8S3_HALHC|nr:LacI family DNA-binding transcriptional regulator [Halobacteroides halobius]AGB41687.1 transcriptional regulator [Halobacteroides halobius DSM 5150]
MVTINDIAKRAGVSNAAVSYALNDSPQINNETKKKILKIAKEMNYKPNSVAKSLRTMSTKTIGVVVEDITSFHTPDIINGINKYAEKAGYHIILENLRLIKKEGRDFSAVLKHKKEINEVINILLSKQVEGIIYVGHHTRDVSDLIDKTDKPMVYTYCYNDQEKSNHSINYNDKLAAYEATEYLIDHGHKKIGVISGPINSIPSHKRLVGYQKALIDNGLVYNPLYTKTGGWTRESGYIKMKEFLSDSDSPTAILAMNDLMAVGVIKAAKDGGLKVPQDLSVIGFDNREFSFYYQPQITTIDLPLDQMGEKSTEILIDIIENNIQETAPLNLKCELIKRDSVSRII